MRVGRTAVQMSNGGQGDGEGGVDWASVPLHHLLPFEVGGLRVHPGTRDNDLGIADLLIEVGESFGSGWHPTTRLCLERAFEVVRDRPVLDFGSGTGILALAALKLGAPVAVGVEIDEASLQVARRNADRNGLSAGARWVREIPARPLFGWVVANMLTAPLLASSARLVAAVDRGGELSLSGLGRDQVDRVVKSYRHAGCRLIQVVERDDWVRIDLAGPW